MTNIKIPQDVWCGLEAAKIRSYTYIMDGMATDETCRTYDLCRDIIHAGAIKHDQIAEVRRILYDEISLTKARLQSITEPCPTLRKFLASDIRTYQRGIDWIEKEAAKQ